MRKITLKLTETTAMKIADMIPKGELLENEYKLAAIEYLQALMRPEARDDDEPVPH